MSDDLTRQYDELGRVLDQLEHSDERRLALILERLHVPEMAIECMGRTRTHAQPRPHLERCKLIGYEKS